jgi:hypothetical protein
MVGLVALLWGALRPAARRPALLAALAGVLGWGAWLLLDFARDPGAFARAGGRVGAILEIPGWGLVALTLLFAGMLCWSGAALGEGLASGLAGAGRVTSDDTGSS